MFSKCHFLSNGEGVSGSQATSRHPYQPTSNYLENKKKKKKIRKKKSKKNRKKIEKNQEKIEKCFELQNKTFYQIFKSDMLVKWF